MTASAPPAALRAARRAVAAIFFLLGVGVASWVVRIPAVQARLGIGPGVLGVVLLGAAVGSLVAMPPAGRWVVRRGSAPVTRLAAVAFPAVLPLLALAPTPALLTAALVAFGAVNGVLGVAMNAQAATVERGYGRPIMSSFHALFSAGGLAGAALGGAVADAGIDPLRHLLGVAAVGVAAGALAGRPLLPAVHDAAPTGTPARTRISPRLAALGTLAFCVLFVEGAMADWTAVYLRSEAAAGPGMAAAGYAAFSITMAGGRTVGDALTRRLGGARLVRLGGSLATAGLALALVAPRAGAVVAGFGAVGAGLAAAFPAVLAAASRLPGVPSGAGIALVSTFGYTGFLAGPPLIGFVAELSTLRGGLAVAAGAAALVTLLAVALRPAPARDASPAAHAQGSQEVG